MTNVKYPMGDALTTALMLRRQAGDYTAAETLTIYRADIAPLIATNPAYITQTLQQFAHDMQTKVSYLELKAEDYPRDVIINLDLRWAREKLIAARRELNAVTTWAARAAA